MFSLCEADNRKLQTSICKQLHDMVHHVQLQSFNLDIDRMVTASEYVPHEPAHQALLQLLPLEMTISSPLHQTRTLKDASWCINKVSGEDYIQVFFRTLFTIDTIQILWNKIWCNIDNAVLSTFHYAIVLRNLSHHRPCLELVTIIRPTVFQMREVFNVNELTVTLEK